MLWRLFLASRITTLRLLEGEYSPTFLFPLPLGAVADFDSRHSLPESDAPTLDFVARMMKLVQDTNVKKTGVRLLTPPNFVLEPGTVSAEDVYGSNLPRLRKLKAKYDPKKVWSKSVVVIEPDFGA